jgi:hypothetical protein
MRYYEKYGRATDWVVRCSDCRRLVVPTDTTSACRCGCRRVTEVRSLSPWEWLKIKFGILNFPHRREFLSEMGLKLW